MMLFISFPAMTMMNSVSGHINVMHLIVFCGILNNKDDLGHGQFMGIGRRLRGWGEVGLEGSDCFWQLGKVVTVGGCDAFCPAIAQR